MGLADALEMAQTSRGGGGYAIDHALATLDDERADMLLALLRSTASHKLIADALKDEGEQFGCSANAVKNWRDRHRDEVAYQWKGATHGAA